MPPHNALVTILRPTRTADGQGGHPESFAPLPAREAAFLSPRSASETTEGGREESRVRWSAVFRRKAPVKRNDRLRAPAFPDLEVLSVSPQQGAAASHLEAVCEEVELGG